MILPTNQAQATATARKTTHRLRVGRWTPGKRIPIRDPDELLCHVEITAVHPDVLVDLTREQASAEGFGGIRGPLTFRRAWLQRYDRAWLNKEDRSDEDVAQRFNARHAGDPIIILTWQLVEAPDLYLAQPTRGSGDYTSNRHRAIDPLPVMGPTPEMVKKAREEGERQRASFRRDLEAERARQKAQRRPWLHAA